MSKKKKGETVISIDANRTGELLKKIAGQFQSKGFEIKEAAIKDDYCNYSYDITEGIGAGDNHKVKGTGIVDPDMHLAFNKFNVHLAVIDDIYKHSNIEIDDIDKFHNHDLTLLFNVTGFKVKGGDANQSVVLSGTKYVTSAVGRMELDSVPVLLESSSGYKWYNELKDALTKAQEEVAAYKMGKYTKADKDLPEEETPELVFESNEDATEG